MQHDLLHVFFLPAHNPREGVLQYIRKKKKDILTKSRGRGCVKGQKFCLHCVLFFSPINLIRNMTPFIKEKNTSDPNPGSRVCVKQNSLLRMLHSL